MNTKLIILDWAGTAVDYGCFAPVGAFALRVPGAEFAVIPGAAHGLMSDRPAETLALLRGFLARHDGE